MFTIQFPFGSGRILSSREGAKLEDNGDIMDFLRELISSSKIPTLHNRVPNNANKLAPAKMFYAKRIQNRTVLTFDSSAEQKTINRANGKGESSIENSIWPRRSFIVKRTKQKSLKSRRWKRSGIRSGVKRRRLRMKIQNVSANKTVNDTGSQKSVQNQSNPIVYGKIHPCNSVQTSAITYKTSNIECRRWEKSELKQQMNCLGKFNHQYLAASFQEAMKFKDLDTGKSLDLSKSFILNRSSYTHQKRDVEIDPGETMITQCHAKKSTTESGYLRICPSCSAITRQPSTPRRFPEYINELLCDPQMVSNYLPGLDALCVQKTFTLDLLQFDGDWELDPTLSAEAGHDVYVEQWELYTQTIRRHCACELLPSSLIATYL